MKFKKDAYKLGIICENYEQLFSVYDPTSKEYYPNIKYNYPIIVIITYDNPCFFSIYESQRKDYNEKLKTALTFAEAIDLTESQFIDPPVEMEVKDAFSERWTKRHVSIIDKRMIYSYYVEHDWHQQCRPIPRKKEKYFMKSFLDRKYQEVSKDVFFNVFLESKAGKHFEYIVNGKTLFKGKIEEDK